MMSMREIALRIVRLRRLLQLGMVAELMDDVDEYDRLLAEFESQSAKLPLWLTLSNALVSRVSEPSRRKVEREGILAQSPGSSHVHHYTRRDELDTWLCGCGASYMGAHR